MTAAQWEIVEKDNIDDLQVLEPLPISEEPIDSQNDGRLPSSESPKSANRILGLFNHHMTGIQKYSSLTFTVFLTFHITNTSLLPLATKSVSAADPYLLLTRPYYQSPIAEPLIVVAPLLLHVGSGLALRIYRRHQTAKLYGSEPKSSRPGLWQLWPNLSGTSMLGIALAPLVVGHATINRLLPLYFEGGSSGIGLQFVAHGFARHKAVSFVGFSALISIASWHVVWGAAKWLGWSPAQVTSSYRGGMERSWMRKRRFYILNAVSAALAGCWMAGGLGVVGLGGETKGWVGRGYDDLFRQIPVLGPLY
ncbi:MAG: hypothetical protein M1829_004303 [Trizodia sp. TS-e1964]|nr:MAG: hypothetical protein M1829_004303 [Trizodia sp. TS-e1964]